VLESYGWSKTLQQQFQPHAARGLAPGRVIVQRRGLYLLATRVGDVSARPSGRFTHEADAGMQPVAGDWVAAAIRPDEAVLLGSSGVGKSSLVNALAGTTVMATREVRQDDARGRHTTTHRQLILLPSGRLVLATPGMRELGLWQPGCGVATTFADIEALAPLCRFRDCTHGPEPGCAVAAAIARGALDRTRLRSYSKLQRELARDARKDHAGARAVARKIEKQVDRDNRMRRTSHFEDD
jgi:energy-coupling factor transporter ATP-binding protein EcfA2